MNLSLYLVTDREGQNLENFFRIIRESIEGGVTVVQLREKEASARETIEIGRRLLAMLKPLGVPLIINDRVDVAHAIKADGVHLGQTDLGAADARAILGPGAIIGLSVETADQVTEAQDVDYLAASPVFLSQTKTDCSKPWGLEGLRRVCALSRHPVVAIGGISAANVDSVRDCGVAGVAVVSSIFRAPCPKTAAQELGRRVYGKSSFHCGI